MKTRMSLGSMLVGACALIAMSLPAAAAPVAQGAQAVQAPNRGTSLRAGWPGLTSSNWSGYAATPSGSAKYTYAASSWIVPAVQKKPGFSSSWVGIDGFNNSNLIQTGTEQDYTNGHAIYRAWWEILPAAETIIPSLTIHPGDTMKAFVKNTSGNQWTISITDVTTGKSFSINKTYNGPGASAEWIQEAPSNGGGVLKLAHYSKTQFFNIQTGQNFGAPANAVLQFPGKAIAMVQGGKRVSTPSKPTNNSFNVAYGAKQPAPPA
jgi:Peptidase A4 family